MSRIGKKPITIPKGVTVKVVDGAVEAFQHLVAHLLPKKMHVAEVLARACRLGEWVATQPGATPPYNANTPR